MARYVVTARIEVEQAGPRAAEHDTAMVLAGSVHDVFTTVAGYEIVEVEPGALKEDG